MKCDQRPSIQRGSRPADCTLLSRGVSMIYGSANERRNVSLVTACGYRIKTFKITRISNHWYLIIYVVSSLELRLQRLQVWTSIITWISATISFLYPQLFDLKDSEMVVNLIFHNVTDVRQKCSLHVLHRLSDSRVMGGAAPQLRWMSNSPDQIQWISKYQQLCWKMSETEGKKASRVIL